MHMLAHKTKFQECKKNLVEAAVLLPSKENRKPIHIKSNHNKSLQMVLQGYHYSAVLPKRGWSHCSGCCEQETVFSTQSSSLCRAGISNTFK